MEGKITCIAATLYLPPSRPEIWKNISGFENSYAISSWGRIKSIKTGVKGAGNILNPTLSGYGYPTIGFRVKDRRLSTAVHVLLANHFIENPLNLEMVNHKDTNKLNYNLDNLEYVTRGQNIAHGFLIKGRSYRGLRLGTLEYLHKVNKFKSVEEMLTYIRKNYDKELKITKHENKMI